MVGAGEGESTFVAPFLVRFPRRSVHRIVLSLFFALLMIGSPFVVGSGTASSTPAAHAPVAGMALVEGFHPVAHVAGSYIPSESGAQLQQAPLVSDSSTAPQLANETILGVTPPDSPMFFTVGFTMNNESELAQIISEQSTPGSPMYRQWLTHAEENETFAANPTAVQDAINYYTAEGFDLLSRGPISVSFTGTAAQVEGAFHTGLDEADNATGVPSSVNTQTLSLPAPLAPYITTIGGLNSIADAQVALAQSAPTSSDTVLDPALAEGSPGPVSVPVQYGSASGGQTGVQPSSAIYQTTNISDLFNYTNHAFGWVPVYDQRTGLYRNFQVVTPASLAYMYGEQPLLNAGYNGKGENGTPITIAVLAFGGINPSDFRTFSQEVFNNPNQLLDRLSVLPVDGAFGLNGTLYYTDGDSSEMALDIEFSSTLAPAAHIIATYGEVTNGYNDQLAALYALPQAPNIITCSFGGEQDYDNLYGPNWGGANWITNNYFMLLTALGTTVTHASGDGGGFDGPDRGNTGVLSGEWPSGDPYSMPVEGIRTVAAGPNGQPFPAGANVTIGWTNTTFLTAYGDSLDNFQMRIAQATQTVNLSYWYEPYSNYTLERAAPQGAGGFGISEWFQQPWWEHGPSIPNIGRELDSGVAAEADYNESIFFDGQWSYGYGGTSFACPTDAGLLALIDNYLEGHGLSPYMGLGDAVTNLVGNAWENGNLTGPGLAAPYWDVMNGTSFWANQGEVHNWTWPRGEVFPYNGTTPTFGDTGKYWSFPTGWGVINPSSFASDLVYLLELPGSFAPMNGAGTQYEPALWGNLTDGSSYVFQVNSTTAINALQPAVTVVFESTALGQYAYGNESVSFQPHLTSVGADWQFTLDTSSAPFTSPGTILFEFGDRSDRTLGFAYSWIAPYIAPNGVLNVSVVDPTTTFPGGSPNFNFIAGSGGSPFDPVWSALPYPNEFTVLVTYNGVPVYNAAVTATIPNPSNVSFLNSLAEDSTFYYVGRVGAYTATNIMDVTYTNLTGDALIDTYNMVSPTPYSITASYGGQVANTSYMVNPMPNAKPVDNYGGTYSIFNGPEILLQDLRLPVTSASENLYFPNVFNQSDYYNYIFAWQGEELTVSVNNYEGTLLGNMPVWLGLPDVGRQTRFTDYSATFGDLGITNTSGTASVTSAQPGPGFGEATVYVPDNISSPLTFGGGASLELLGISVPGEQNRSVSESEPCSPAVGPTYTGPATPLITCVYNNSYERNYTTAPVVALPDPVFAYTQTTSQTPRDFFGTGSNISWEVNVSLPDSNPFEVPVQPGYNWDPQLEHIVSMNAYVDGIFAGNLTPPETTYAQDYNVYGNLTGVYGPGIHVLTAVVVDSLGHVFTYRHVFIIGSIAVSDLSPSQVYTVLPYELDWSLDLPASEISNRTFNMSLAVQYVTNVYVHNSLQGCGGFGLASCPQLVNLSIPIHPGQTVFNQSLNRTLLERNGFYSGGTDIPPGQYQILIWLNANHSGSISDEITTYFVFDPLTPSIDGPAPNAVVPVGNVTISYSYTGLYISNALLAVYAASDLVTPVFQTGAYTPGTGIESNSTTWTSVQPGAYQIVLDLLTPYQNNTTSEWINVTASQTHIYHNGSSGPIPLFGLSIPAVVTSFAIAGALAGLLLAAYVAPTLLGRGPKGPESEGPSGGAEGGGGTSEARSSMLTCPICQDTFESQSALDQHAAVIHGQSK